MEKFSFHFSSSNKTIDFSDNDKDVYYKNLGSDTVILDSGTSFMMMPNSILTWFQEVLFSRGTHCTYDYHVSSLLCSCITSNYIDQFPDLKFTMSGHNYFIPREEYLGPRQFTQCQILISNGDVIGSNTWLLGIEFMENYYMVFDNENYRVGMGVSKVASERI